MPRDSNGNYTLPAGNPVVTLTVISSNWANTTMSDLSTAMTDSLSRSGQGSMLAPLELVDGAIGAPGLTWGTEGTSGLYRAGVGDFRYSISSTEVLRINANLLQLSGTAPIFRLNESDAAANNRLWDAIVSGEDLIFRVRNDADSAGTNWLVVNRTGTAIDGVVFPADPTVGPGVTINGSGGGTDSGLQLNCILPSINWFESDASANNRSWDVSINTEQMTFRVINDANTVATTWMAVDRTGTVVDSVTLSPTNTIVTGALTGNSTFQTATLVGLNLSSAYPAAMWTETDAAANNRIWTFEAQGEQFTGRVWNDLTNSTTAWVTVDRTGATIDLINFATPLLQAQGIHNGTAPTGTNNYIASGTYTPTLTAVANVDASTSAVCQWIRVGRVVTVSGVINIDATAAVPTLTSLGISLPVASNIGNQSELGGAGVGSMGGVLPWVACQISGDTINDRATFAYLATDTANRPFTFSFTYLVN